MTKAKFEVKNGELYINGNKVLKGYESYNGWYWFVTEEVEPGIYFGFVQGLEEEWGSFSQEEIDSLIRRGLVWEIRKKDLPFAGRR